MRTIRLDIEFPRNGSSETLTFQVDDDATDEQIAADAETEFYNRCNFGWGEIDAEDSTL